MPVKARAVVRLKIEITVGDTWGADCALPQIWKQATESAVDAVRRGMPHGVRLIGEPEVDAILVSEPR